MGLAIGANQYLLLDCQIKLTGAFKWSQVDETHNNQLSGTS